KAAARVEVGRARVVRIMMGASQLDAPLVAGGKFRFRRSDMRILKRHLCIIGGDWRHWWTCERRLHFSFVLFLLLARLPLFLFLRFPFLPLPIPLLPLRLPVLLLLFSAMSAG